MKDPKTPGDRAARRGSQVALAGLVILSCAFVLSSTWQLTAAAFGAEGDSLARGESARIKEGPCKQALRGLSASVDQGLSAAATARSSGDATEAFERGVATGWQSAPRAAELCAAEPEGTSAYASVERLRAAALAFSRHRASDLAKVRGEVSSEIGP
jgi:hypothetical protein